MELDLQEPQAGIALANISYFSLMLSICPFPICLDSGDKVYFKVYSKIRFLDLRCLLIMVCGYVERPQCTLVCSKKPVGRVQSIPTDMKMKKI